MIKAIKHQNFLEIIFYFLSNRQAFENIYRMLRPNGTMLVLFVTSHDIFKILENLAQNDRFAPFMVVNIVIYINYYL